MFRDVTFGQYYPTSSFVHKMDARAKLLLVILYMVAIFFVKSYFGFAIVTVFLALAIGFSRVPLKSLLKSIKGILFILIFTSILNLFLNKNGKILVDWWIFTITDEGIKSATKLILRLTYLVMGSSLLTLTTTPVELTHAIEKLLKPLKVIKFPVRDFALIMSLTLSLIPSLMEETDRIIRAQKARGASFDSGGLIKRAKAFIPILIPLLVSSFTRAKDLATAMESRCFDASQNPTRMHVMKFSWRDLLGVLTTVLFMTAIFVLYGMASKWGHITWMFF